MASPCLGVGREREAACSRPTALGAVLTEAVGEGELSRAGAAGGPAELGTGRSREVRGGCDSSHGFTATNSEWSSFWAGGKKAV